MAQRFQSVTSQGSSPLTMKRFRIGDGDAGVLATVRMMQSITFGPEGVGNAHVRSAALEAVQGVQRGMDEIHSIFQWVKDNIEFRGEYSETLQTPLVTLQLGAGDCDDHSTLLAAMFESLGFETRFNTISVAEDPQDDFSHVFLEVKVRSTGEWLPVDTTVRSSYPGWKPANARRQKIRASSPAGLRNGQFMQDLFWLGVGLVVSGVVMKKRR